MDPALFIRSKTAIAAPPLVPEIRLYLATEVTPIWHATESSLARSGLPPPYWAFAWAGGQALARYLLDHPETVAGRGGLDIGSGPGIVAIAAAKAGAARVVAADIDRFAAAAIALNAPLNGVAVRVETRDLLDRGPAGWEIALAGDICYEEPMSARAGAICSGRPMSSRAIARLRRMAAARRLALLGDPGRAYLPREGLVERAR